MTCPNSCRPPASAAYCNLVCNHRPMAIGFKLSHLAGDAVDNLELTGSDAANLSGATG